MKKPICCILFIAILIFSCKKEVEKVCYNKIFQVTATAYNSLAYQTSSNPHITAFGDSLKPGMRYIAVSRDLLDSGLVHNTKVKLDGFDSLYIVKDKMNRRWRKRIDIYMGIDVKKAKQWGKRKVNIEYCTPLKDSISH
ncbi:3D domain-containing protein [Winogradskyella sp. PG-2]|uniref:3D domain-containing protein n=1 Tax=Winogradskyella sp. PG-2 TaxID=754409 RepID=UPI0005EF9256|nr:3D domain-containing protein [Winogradskyella sp. PG-2]